MNSKVYESTALGLLGESWGQSLPTATNPLPPSSTATWSRGGDGRKKPTVLVVEDDDDSLLGLKTLLAAKGYHVIAAWDGEQALEIANSEDLDLVLLDLQLPRISGLSVIHHLRDRPELESLPIVIMTGREPEEYREKAIRAGCDAFLAKPIDIDHFEALLDYFAPVSAAESLAAS